MAAPQYRHVPSGRSGPIRVLLIESRSADPHLRRALTFQTRSTQFSLECVRGFGAGIEAIRRRAHDVCLFDSRLDEEGG